MSDCACDCVISPAISTPPHALSELLPSTRYQMGQDLYTTSLTTGDNLVSEERVTLFFNPMGGTPALLNQASCDLLEAFAPARSIDQVAAQHAHWHPDHIRKASTQLINLSLLRPADGPLAVSCHHIPDTLAVWLHVNNQCNLRCDYCYIRKTEAALTPEIGRRAIDAVFRSAIRHGFRGIKLKYAGGEASLNANTWLPLHDFAVQQSDGLNLDLDAVLLSNGVALGRRLIETLRERGIRVMISLDGVGATHDAQRKFPNGRGSFEAVSRTLDRLQKLGVTPFVSVTVSGRNLAGLPVTVAYLLERALPFGLYFYRDNECTQGLSDLRFDEAQVIEAMNDAFDVIEANLPGRVLLGALVDRASFLAPHRWPCGVGQNYLVIGPSGTVSKCQMEMERPVTSIFADDPLASIQSDLRGLQNPPVDEKVGCRDCTWRYWCAGGCPLTAYRASGRYDIKSPNCRIYQALYPRVLRLEGLRLLRGSQ